MPPASAAPLGTSSFAADSSLTEVRRYEVAARRHERGFTLVELLIVVLIIALLLGIGLPAFNSMSRDADRGKARQLLNGVLQRANIIALSDKNLTAVRIAPSEWIVGDVPARANQPGGRQAVMTYSQTVVTDHPSLPQATFMDLPRFRAVSDAQPVLLPASNWAAPLEALVAAGADADSARQPAIGGPVVAGTIGLFAETAASSSASVANTQFLDADDFLIVFNPDGTVAPATTPSMVNNMRDPTGALVAPQPWRLSGFIPFIQGVTSGYAPQGGFEAPGRWRPNAERYNPEFTRNNFTGVVLYDRLKMLSLGLTAATTQQMEARRAVLRTGLPLYVNRVGGALVEGNTQ